mgnify:CR=1 FL=1
MKNKKRMDFHSKFYTLLPSFITPFITVIGTFILSSLIMWITKIDVGNAWSVMLQGSLGSISGICTTLVKSTPLILVGLGMSVAFRSGLFNIGAEGQMYLGGLAATIIGTWQANLPSWIQLTAALIFGFIGGASWAIIPGYLKAKYQTNIIITTILMNYIGLYLVDILVYGPLRANKESTVSLPESESVIYKLPTFIPGLRLHIGFLIAIFFTIFIYILMYKTALGMEMCLIGPSPETSRTIGIPVIKRSILAMSISGGLAGLAGAIEILAVQFRLRPMFVGNLGYTGIAVALLGSNNPIGVFLSSLFFGILRNGSSHMQSKVGVPLAITSVIEGITMLLLILMIAFMSKRNGITNWIESKKAYANPTRGENNGMA